MKSFYFVAVMFSFSLLSSSHLKADDQPFPLNAKKILFLGDSITHAGHYISIIEGQLRLQSLGVPELINLGLPSETCSGLSEPDHPFPRPDVHERIDRALDKVKPDVVVACYGMNDGIYYPFSEDRFEKYQTGIREIIKKVNASGARLILMTPPAFDPLPLKEKGKLLPAGEEKYAWFSIYEGYDDVMKKYAAWVMTLKDDVDMVIDLHTPVNEYVMVKRKSDPQFTMSPDGVHVNEEGHFVIAAAILKAWSIQISYRKHGRFSELVHQKQTILHNSWLSHVGHKRPGVKDGLPLDEAKMKADEVEKKIQERIIWVKPNLLK
ncbi:SGNH/GDSL hydrolase family protein [Planctomicrobium sp.]|jgi:lysophospholipase L1-like esterase|nr:SGNH/GDSL hydrolase family protein [Planctomicrobium sp.]MBT5020684.1 SGNH/GDSL hydrolase family protein [Planctomicrobium sp.]MDA7503621.1 SGNH/GDSL hydrolase family protein [bacterium]MDB4731595.1 SGNH/GDSL hydrolase family protein [bacterium]MDB4743438.1 SGNH/GDSL hydrolase family protein [Planctomicrobium sp.]